MEPQGSNSDSQPMEGTPALAENGEGPRRRRRRGGRGGERGERPDRGERPPRDSFAADASPADAIEAQAARLESAREPSHEAPPQRERSPERATERSEYAAPVHEPVSERTEPEPPVHEPKLAYSSAPPARTFQAVSEHDDAAESDAHRPNRKRRHEADASSQAQALQLVETQAEAQPIALDDDLPRRTKPRRKRSGPVVAEPLKLVETQPGTEVRPEGSSTP